jgi:hypothetical protein
MDIECERSIFMKQLGGTCYAYAIIFPLAFTFHGRIIVRAIVRAMEYYDERTLDESRRNAWKIVQIASSYAKHVQSDKVEEFNLYLGKRERTDTATQSGRVIEYICNSSKGGEVVHKFWYGGKYTQVVTDINNLIDILGTPDSMRLYRYETIPSDKSKLIAIIVKISREHKTKHNLDRGHVMPIIKCNGKWKVYNAIGNTSTIGIEINASKDKAMIAQDIETIREFVKHGEFDDSAEYTYKFMGAEGLWVYANGAYQR